jgi:DNA-binding NarL/FixJ family response regulator
MPEDVQIGSEPLSASILAVGARVANRLRQASESLGADANPSQVVEAADSELAIDLLRVLKFDLVATEACQDGSEARLISFLQRAWPGQKWALVAEQTTEAEELAARRQGATAVLDGPEAWKSAMELANRIRAARPHARVKGLKLRLDRTTRPAKAG